MDQVVLLELFQHAKALAADLTLVLAIFEGACPAVVPRFNFCGEIFRGARLAVRRLIHVVHQFVIFEFRFRSIAQSTSLAGKATLFNSSVPFYVTNAQIARLEHLATFRARKLSGFVAFQGCHEARQLRGLFFNSFMGFDVFFQHGFGRARSFANVAPEPASFDVLVPQDVLVAGLTVVVRHRTLGTFEASTLVGLQVRRGVLWVEMDVCCVGHELFV